MARLALWLMVIVPLLAGCSEYHPMKDGAGFKDEAVGEDGYRVTYTARAEMPAEEAWRYALVRAAEVTVLRNGAYFQIEEEQMVMERGVRYRSATNSEISLPVATPNGGGGMGVVSRIDMPGYAQTYWIPEVTLKIQVSAEASEKGIPAAYVLKKAMADKIALSPGVAEKVAGMPEVSGAVTIPPPPMATTRPL